MNAAKITAPRLRFTQPDGTPFPDWEEKRLGDIVVMFSGGTPTSTQASFYEGKIPFIRSGEISAEKTELFISDEGLKQSSAKLVNAGDILYALYGATSGEVAISKISGAINQAILCIRSDQNIEYIYQWLNYNKSRITSGFLQGGQGNLSAEIIQSLNIHITHPDEQAKIAEVLSDADALITSLEKLIEKKSAIYSRLNQVIFSKYINSSGAINKTLAHYGDFVTGVGFPLYLQGRYNGGIPFFKVSDFNLPTNDRTLIVANNYVARADLSELGGNLIKKGSLVFAKIGAAIFLERKRQTFTESLVDNNVAAYEVKSDITDSDFIYFLFNFLKLSKFSASSTLPVIDIRELAKLPISLPELEEQKIIALKLNLFYAEIKLLKKQLNKAKKIKAGMMQELLTGRTRLI